MHSEACFITLLRLKKVLQRIWKSLSTLKDANLIQAKKISNVEG